MNFTKIFQHGEIPTKRNNMAKVHTGVAALQPFRQRNNRQLQRHDELRDSHSSTVEFPPTLVVRQNSRHRFVSRFKTANVFNHSTTNTIGVHKVKRNASENTSPHIFKNVKHVQKSILPFGVHKIKRNACENTFCTYFQI